MWMWMWCDVNWGVCFIPKGWITIVWPLSWEDDNWQSRFHTLGKNALSVVIVSWNWSEHNSISYIYETKPDSCLRLMTTDREWLFIPKVWSMLRQLSSSHGNSQVMVIYLKVINDAPSFVIVSWQRSEHGDIPLIYETCSVRCHRLMTTVRAW